MQARIGRLERLAQGLAKEIALWRGGNDPLLYTERQAYLRAIQNALASIETARVVLVKAHQRFQENTS